MFQGRSFIPALALAASAVHAPVSAGPTLHMHVFDGPTQPEAKPIQNKKPALKLHVFKSKEQIRPNSGALNTQAETRHLELDRDSGPSTYKKINLYFKTGYQRDDFVWNKAGPGGSPNILSELSWDDLEIATISVGGDYYIDQNWFTQFEFGYGKIWDGENQDSDYLGDNRTLEFSRSNNGADEGYLYDITANLAYRHQFYNQDSHSAYLVPKVGFSYHKQKLKIVDGKQTIPVEAGIADLDSSYEATWYGPWLGLSSQYMNKGKFSLQLGIEYHYAFYDASATWNLRPEFEQPESFTHEARGYGWIYNASANYQIKPNLSLGFELVYEDWLADKNGKERIYFSNGSEAALKFNEAERNSVSANLELNYAF